jgi:hypothetical protein
VQSKKKQEVSEELYRYARSGASVHQILSKIKTITYEEAQRAVQQVAEDNKTASPAHRANLRNVIREQAMGALEIISKIARDETQKSEVRLKAAETMLKYASEFIDETVMRSWQERPDTNVEIQQTIFDFGPLVEANGDIAFRGQSRLLLIESEEEL